MSTDATKASGMARSHGAFTRNIPDHIMLAIKQKVAAGERATDISRQFGVSRQWIHEIKRRGSVGAVNEDFRLIGHKAATKLLELMDYIDWRQLLAKSPESVPKIMVELAKLGHGAEGAMPSEEDENLSDAELQESINRLSRLLIDPKETQVPEAANHAK